jgi:hypothetical protein
MNADADPDAVNKTLFINIVMMFAASAMQHLGKVINPLTGKTEVDLEGAQATIDILLMLQAKTRGNLDRTEERVLKDTIASLQLNYVETARPAPPPTPEAADREPEPQPPKDGNASSAGAEPPPKFHKTYPA